MLRRWRRGGRGCRRWCWSGRWSCWCRRMGRCSRCMLQLRFWDGSLARHGFDREDLRSRCFAPCHWRKSLCDTAREVLDQSGRQGGRIVKASAVWQCSRNPRRHSWVYACKVRVLVARLQSLFEASETKMIPALSSKLSPLLELGLASSPLVVPCTSLVLPGARLVDRIRLLEGWYQ